MRVDNESIERKLEKVLGPLLKEGALPSEVVAAAAHVAELVRESTRARCVEAIESQRKELLQVADTWGSTHPEKGAKYQMRAKEVEFLAIQVREMKLK